MAINLLPCEIYNKISAGEVVENPAGVVKELVENSIDGGASRISIEIYNGGINRIIVSDNGCGISFDDIEKAFLPHATSKISKEEDLYSISSLGFRGEALASIAAVSNVEIFSKTEDSEFGGFLKISGGSFGQKREIGFEKGTKIIVSNLFYNTPARLKFLKKPKSEEGEVTNLVAKIIMANPQLSFRYCIDDKIIYNTFGNGLAEAIYIVYGKETYDNLLEVNYERDGIRVFGYIARPTFCKPNRTYQTIFVNGRVVSNYMISAAVQDALEGYIMKGKFPLFALNITIPYDSVDVNIHPTKQEVKFEFPNKIYSIVNNAIFKTISEGFYVQETEKENIEKGDGKFDKENIYENNKEKDELLKIISKDSVNMNELSFKSSENLLSKIFYEKYLKNNFENNLRNNTNENLIKNNLNNKDKEDKFSNFVFEEVEINTSETNEEKNNIKFQEKIENIFENYKLIGVLFETYILIEKDNKLFIIDQHAAHERQLFDKLKDQIENNEVTSQQLLVPYVLSTNQKEAQFLQENLNLLIDFGIEITQFGDNTFKISAVPSIISNINLNSFFDLVLNDVSSYLKKPIDIIKNKIATMACRAAVKAGDNLSDEEIKILLTNFRDNGNVLLCPHGRPVIISLDRKEIERWFKRIV